MKRTIIWVSAMVLWFLIFSTIFSFWVERTMTPIVTECRPQTTQISTEPRLDLNCLFVSEDGTPVLYQIFDGLAWEAGTRIKNVTPSSYNILDDHISYYGQEPVAQYSTKELRLGEKAIVAAKAESRKDLYLAICPTGVRLRDDLPENFAVIFQTENALLVEKLQAPSIFMAKRVTSELFQRQPFLFPDERVYSLVDVKVFFDALPLTALLPGMMLFVLILWLFSFPLLKDLRENKGRLIANACFAAVILLILPVLLYFLHFPSSLMPKDNIVDASHYIRAFSENLTILRLFADSDVSTAQTLLAHVYVLMWLSIGIIFLCVVLAICLALFHSHYSKIWKSYNPSNFCSFSH